MDLTFVGWIIVGLIAGAISGIIAGGRTLRGWMPSLAIGLIAAVVIGWIMTTFVGSDGITSIYVAAVLATVAAIVIRLLIKTVSFSE
jgi:uncharacterized membrane protein YeaQ/YmgE (transglycosylase-associated protein family)